MTDAMPASESSKSLGPLSGAKKASGRWTVDADAVDRWCERGILGLVLFLLVFGPLAFGAVDVPQILTIQAVTGGILLLWVARLWLARSYRLLWAPIGWAVLLFVLYGFVRYRMLLAEGGIEYLARQEVILVLVYGALFFAILNNLSRQESTQIITLTLLGLGAVLSFYALYQFLTKSKYVLWTLQYPVYLGRGSGTYICPNHLAGLLEMILPLGLAYTLCGRFRPTAKVFLGYAAVAIFTGIGVSISRGAWVATGLGLLVFFGLLMRQRGQRLAGLVFFVLLIGAFFFFFKNLSLLERRAGVSPEDTKIDAVRWEIWRPSYRMWQDHFWWGVGPAQFDERFRAYRPDDIQMRPLYTHNDYLNTLVDWGVVGLGIIAGAVGLLFLGVIQSWKFIGRSNDLTTKRSNRSAFVLGALAGLTALLAHSAVEFNMHIPANAVVAVTLMALLAGHLRFASERFWFKMGGLSKLAATAALLACAGYLGMQTLRRAKEEFWLTRAARTRDFSTRLEALKAAYAIEPSNYETTYALGEADRLASWQGLGRSDQWAEEAIPWFRRTAELNRFDPYSQLRWGMCLDWLDRSAEAREHFERALELDPKNYFIQGHLGWHYFQAGDWKAAEHWFKQSIYQAHWHPAYRFQPYSGWNVYLAQIEKKRAEKAAAP